MKKTIEELYAIEGRDPWSIRRWLRGEGFEEARIDKALQEYAEKIASGYRFGYKNGISVLSHAIRNRVSELAMGDEMRLSDAFGDYLFKKPLRQIIYRSFLKLFGKSDGDK